MLPEELPQLFLLSVCVEFYMLLRQEIHSLAQCKSVN
jgi:hypothetical protein